MGWHDDEQKAWWPDWATAPLAWTGCLLAAVAPAAMALSFWDALFPDASLLGQMAVYGVSAGLMIAAVKPWTLR